MTLFACASCTKVLLNSDIYFSRDKLDIVDCAHYMSIHMSYGMVETMSACTLGIGDTSVLNQKDADLSSSYYGGWVLQLQYPN